MYHYSMCTCMYIHMYIYTFQQVVSSVNCFSHLTLNLVIVLCSELTIIFFFYLFFKNWYTIVYHCKSMSSKLLEKTLMLGKIEGRRRRGWQRMRYLGGITSSMDVSLNKLQELVGDGQGGLAWYSPWGRKEWDTTERLNWTEHSSVSVERIIIYLAILLLLYI